MNERAQRISGLRAHAIEASLAVPFLLAACGGDKAPATQPILPTEQPNPTLIVTPTPEVTASPEPTATPEPTPSTNRVTDGTAYFDAFKEWKKTNTSPVNATNLQTGIKDLVNSPLVKDSTDPKIAGLYNALIGADLLVDDFKFITSKNSTGQDFMSSCSDMVSDMTMANNYGIDGAINYAYETQVLCESIAKKRGIPLHDSTNTGLDDIIKTNLDALLG